MNYDLFFAACLVRATFHQSLAVDKDKPLLRVSLKSDRAELVTPYYMSGEQRTIELRSLIGGEGLHLEVPLSDRANIHCYLNDAYANPENQHQMRYSEIVREFEATFQTELQTYEQFRHWHQQWDEFIYTRLPHDVGVICS